MGKQDVFKGALGWDDWIWWSGIGGLGLFLLMVILCCIVCVQRAKRKGRDEAMAVVQARERERQQQEQAQLRYAQAQQVRYPAREPSYKFSKPEQATYNPFGHDDHQMHRNSYAQPPVPRPKPRRGPQLPPPVVDDTNGQQQQQQQQTLYSIPRRDEQPTAPQEELPQVAAYYGRTPQQNDTIPTPASPKMSQQYQRQQQVNPAQPPIMQYRRRSSTPYRSDVGSVQQDDALQQSSEVPFVQVNSPRNSNASTASTTYSVAAASTSTPLSSMMVYNHNNNSNQSRPIATSVANSYGRPSMTGGTLRDRIDALREGAPQDNAVRISMSSFSSGTPSTVPSPPSKTPPPPKYSSAAPAAPARVSQLMTATMLSDSSYGTDDGAFDEDAFGTARSAQMTQLVREDSEGSVGSGQFDDPETPPHERRDRTGTGDSTGSIEF